MNARVHTMSRHEQCSVFFAQYVYCMCVHVQSMYALQL